MSETVLSMDNVVKNFGGLLALDGVSLEIQESELFGLIGPNGAGKSTLLNVISSVYEPTEGRILHRDDDITTEPIHRIAANGVVRTFQEAKHFGDATARENVEIAVTANRIFLLETFFSAIRRTEADERVSGALATVKLDVEQQELVASEMTHMEQTQLSIARALVNEPDILMLDEPFAGLTSEETNEIASIIQGINDSGTTILLIDHNVGKVTSIADRVALLDQGELLLRGDPETVLEDEQTQEAYFGE